MFLGGEELLKLIAELEAMGKAHMAARIEEMKKPEPVDDFEQFMKGISHE